MNTIIRNWFGIPMLILLFTYAGWKFYAAKKMTFDYAFSGVIQKVVYDEPKHIPTIFVNGESYNLIYCYWGKDTLSVGDSVIKIKGTEELTLIKKHKK